MLHTVNSVEETITVALGIIGILLSLFFGVTDPQFFFIGCGCFFILRNLYQLCDEAKLKYIFMILLVLDTIYVCILSKNCYIFVLLIPLKVLFHKKLLHSTLFHYFYYLLPILLFLISLTLTNDLSTRDIYSYLFLEILFVLYDLLIRILSYYEVMNQKLYALLSDSAIHELEQQNLNKKLAFQNTVIERTARLKERDAIGRTIHNAVGHTITSAIVTLDASELLIDTNAYESKQKIIQAKERMQQSLSSIRQAVRLFDQTTTQVSIADLFDILCATLNEFTIDTNYRIRHNLIVTKELQEQFIDINTSEFLNGAVMEALSNGMRHGHATAFIIISELLHDKLSITILDNGTAEFNDSYNKRDLLTQGYGLKKMHSYLDEIGGDLKIDVKEGFQLTLIVPLIQVNH